MTNQIKTPLIKQSYGLNQLQLLRWCMSQIDMLLIFYILLNIVMAIPFHGGLVISLSYKPFSIGKPTQMITKSTIMTCMHGYLLICPL